MFSSLRRWFFAGLLVWAPLGVTLLVIRFLVGMLDSSLLLVPQRYQPAWFDFPGIGSILTLLLVLITGALTANLLGRKTLDWLEQRLERVPLIGTVYGGMKKIAETVLSGQGNAFQKVVLVQYPRVGVWSVGFVTAAPPSAFAKAGAGNQLVGVFIPTTPNPTSGFLILVARDEVVELEMSVPDGMQYIISLGVVSPR